MIGLLLLCSMVVLIVGCGNGNSNNISLTTTSSTSSTVDDAVAKGLERAISAVDAMNFSLVVTGGDGAEMYTQKGKSFRIDWVNGNPFNVIMPSNQNQPGPIQVIYNSQRKKVAGIWEEGNYKVTSGWTGLKLFNNRNDLDSKESIVGATLRNVNELHGGIGSTGYDGLFRLGTLFDLQKVGNNFSFKTNDADSYYFILECGGPEGLPSRLIKKTPAQGANPEAVQTLRTFIWTNLNQVPDSMFEIPGDIPVDASLGMSTQNFSPQWASLGIY